MASRLVRALALLKPTNLLATALLLGVGYAGVTYLMFRYRAARLGRERQELSDTVARLEAKNRALQHTVERLEAQAAELRTFVKRLTAESRVADVRVLDQRLDADGVPVTTLEFAEAARAGQPPPPARQITVRGGEVYFDALVVTFADDQVKVGDPLRGKSLHLFRRAFGSAQEPRTGPQLATAPDGLVPEAYRASPTLSSFERSLWQRFWHWVDHPKEAEAEGVRVAQIEAVAIRPVVGAAYRITLRHAGGIEIKRMEK